MTNQETNFTYNSLDQLVQATRGPPGARIILGHYDYNASGLRVRHRYSERGDVDYYYDQTAVLEERNASDGSLLAHYTYADRLLSLNSGNGLQYYHHDALGSTVNLTDSDGNTIVSYTLGPWGHIRSQTGSSVNRQIFTGQEHDENTGLIYFGARYYDPDISRFITQDPYLGDNSIPPSLHRYLYAYSNPLFYIDLFGCAARPRVTGYYDQRTDIVPGWNPTIDTGSQVADETIVAVIGTVNFVPGTINAASHLGSAHLVIASEITGKSMEAIDGDIDNVAVTLGPQARSLHALRGASGYRKLVGVLDSLFKGKRVARVEDGIDAVNDVIKPKNANTPIIETTQSGGPKVRKITSEADPVQTTTPPDESIGSIDQSQKANLPLNSNKSSNGSQELINSTASGNIANPPVKYDPSFARNQQGVPGRSHNIRTANMTEEGAVSAVEYARRVNTYVEESGKPLVRIPTKGPLRRSASAAAKRERTRAERAGETYQGQAGHVPDTTWTGLAEPPAGWLDMAGTSNNSVGGFAGGEPLGTIVNYFTINGEMP